MNIGLIDGDFMENTHNVFNLDLMQLSAYHKSKRDYITLIRDTNTVDKFSKVYYVKDYPTPSYPSFLQMPHVEYLGKNLRNGIYTPLADGIRLIRPDTHLYGYDTSTWKKVYQDTFRSNLNGNHVRLEDYRYAQNIQRNFYGQGAIRTPLYIHDYNVLEVPNHLDIINELYCPERVITLKYPVIITNAEQLFAFSKYSYNDNSLIICNFIPSKDELEYLYTHSIVGIDRIIKYKVIGSTTPVDSYLNELSQHISNMKFAHKHRRCYRAYINSPIKEWNSFLYYLDLWAFNSYHETDFFLWASNYMSYNNHILFKQWCDTTGLTKMFMED